MTPQAKKELEDTKLLVAIFGPLVLLAIVGWSLVPFVDGLSETARYANQVEFMCIECTDFVYNRK